MKHPTYRVINFQIVGSYTLHVQFDDDTHQMVDLEDVLEGEIFSPLKDPKLFSQVAIDPEVHTLEWPNGADFDPETLHDWPRYREQMKQMAKQWAATRAPA